jgi:protein ImuB
VQWLALHLPALSLEVYTRGLPSEQWGADTLGCALPAVVHQPPLAVSAHERIIARNAAAKRLGITPGLPEAAARALAAELRILPRKPAAERAALGRLGAWAMAFSDQVSLAPPAALVLEAGRSLRLFGGAAALRQRVLGGITDLGWRARCVLAPTPSAALALAVAGFGSALDVQAVNAIIVDRDALYRVLAGLPVTALGFSRTQLDDLRRMGLTRVGDLLRLPRAGLAERFGIERLEQLERLLGERPDPRRPFVPPQRFRAGLELPAEVPDAPALVFACRRLIDELCGFLHAQQAGVQQLAWRLHHADAASTRFRLGSAAPGREPQHWLELLRERLDRLTLPAPVRAISVGSEPAQPLAPRHGGLLPRDAAAAAPDPALLDRLRARLGPAAVQGLEMVPDHRPERAWRPCEPILPGAAAPRRGVGTRRHPRSAATEDLPPPRQARPLWLLAEPMVLGVRAGRPWLDGPLHLGDGCERIDTGWWDGFPVARDYYVALSSAGERLWIYRDRRGDGGWFLHGLFGYAPGGA